MRWALGLCILLTGCELHAAIGKAPAPDISRQEVKAALDERDKVLQLLLDKVSKLETGAPDQKNEKTP